MKYETNKVKQRYIFSAVLVAGLDFPQCFAARQISTRLYRLCAYDVWTVVAKLYKTVFHVAKHLNHAPFILLLILTTPCTCPSTVLLSFSQGHLPILATI